MIHYVLLVSRQGKLRLAKWFLPMTQKVKTRTIQEVSQLALGRRQRMSNFIEYKGSHSLSCQIVYRRYASLFFICEIGEEDNELITLEVIHRYVESLDRYFGNVCELDLIFNFQKAYAILDELVIAGELQDSSSKNVLKSVQASDAMEEFTTIQDQLRESSLM
ncbi:AP complex, mu/sigma subunit [Panaeolus papilionaceus]|nr:AP complex, mu/sigma subunit [Panaeolus papilionaceus]